MSERALVFGGAGALGGPIASALSQSGLSVTTTSRRGDAGHMVCDPLSDPGSLRSVLAAGPYSVVVWAQGANLNDSATDADPDEFRSLIDINVTFVVATLGALVRGGAIETGARLVVLSSIWESIARPGKFSYAISKAAIGGLVRAASVDLAPLGISINAVLPSVTDTPMTRANLTESQIATVASGTGFGRLVTPEDVARAVLALAQTGGGITGQSIPVDHGFSHTRDI